MQKFSGFTLLFSVVLATSILFLLFNKYYFAPQEKTGEVAEVEPNTSTGTVPTNRIESMRADIDAAEKTRQLLNAQNNATNAALLE